MTDQGAVGREFSYATEINARGQVAIDFVLLQISLLLVADLAIELPSRIKNLREP